MSSASPHADDVRSERELDADPLAALMAVDGQQLAARLAQDAFSRAFKLSFDGDDPGRAAGIGQLADALGNWAAAGEHDEVKALRLALVVAGLDQWGLAYSQAFDMRAIPGLSALIGALRTALDPQAEARFLRQFEALEASESAAIDFKIALRRAIHLALWHAMIACDRSEEAAGILTQLSGMLLALVKHMPSAGWRLVADTLASIQIRCLSDGLAADGLARDTTQGLFEVLSRGLPAAEHDRIMAHATRAVLAWQQANRPVSQLTH